MGKSWSGTPEYYALLNEIKRYPVGTSSKKIFKNLRPETQELLHEANRMSGKTKEYAVYRQICKMNSNISSPATNESSIKSLITQINLLEGQLQELKAGLENLLKD